MSIQSFAYCVKGDSTADADMVRMVKEPIDRPVYLPYGQVFRAGDGQQMFSGASTVTLKWDSLTYDENTDNSALDATTAGVKRFYEDWNRARDSVDQQMVINLIDPITNTWGKHDCVALRPDWSGTENGEIFENFQITFMAIGIAMDTAPGWGEPNGPAYSEDPDTLGDPLVGTAGYGLAGRGIAGYGSMN